MPKVNRSRTGKDHQTQPKNLGKRHRSPSRTPSEEEPSEEVTPPPSTPKSARRKPYAPDDLPQEWCDSQDETGVTITSSKKLDDLTSLVMYHFVEESDNKMLDAMHAAAEYIAAVCKVDVIDVVAPESYLAYGVDWDGSIPDIPHPKIGETFPRLEKYIWDDMAKFFAKAVAKWARKMKKTLHSKVQTKKSWEKICRYLRLYRKAHLFLMILNNDKSRIEINAIVKRELKKCKTECQVKTKTTMITKAHHKLHFPDYKKTDGAKKDGQGNSGAQSDLKPAGQGNSDDEESDKKKKKDGNLIEPTDMDCSIETLLEWEWPNRKAYFKRGQLIDWAPQQTNDGMYSNPPDEFLTQNMVLLAKISFLVDMVGCTQQLQAYPIDFHYNRVAYMKEILCENDEWNDDQVMPRLDVAYGVRLSNGVRHSNEPTQKEIAFALALFFAVFGLWPQGDPTPYLDMMRRIRSSVGLNPHALSQESCAEKLFSIFKMHGTSDLAIQAVSYVQMFASAVVNEPMSELSASYDALIKLPRIAPQQANIILQDGFGHNRGIIINQLNKVFVVASGLVAYEEEFFAVEGGEDFLDMDRMQHVSKSLLEKSLATWVPACWYPFLNNKVPAFVRSLHDPGCTLPENSAARKRVLIVLRDTLGNDAKLKQVLGCLFDAIDFVCGDDLSVPVYDLPCIEDGRLKLHYKPHIPDNPLDEESWHEAWLKARLGHLDADQHCKKFPTFGKAGAMVTNLPCLQSIPTTADNTTGTLTLKTNKDLVGKTMMADSNLYLPPATRTTFASKHETMEFILGKVLATPCSANKKRWQLEWAGPFPTKQGVTADQTQTELANNKTNRNLLRQAILKQFALSQKKDEPDQS